MQASVFQKSRHRNVTVRCWLTLRNRSISEGSRIIGPGHFQGLSISGPEKRSCVPFFSGPSRATVTLFLAVWNGIARPSATLMRVWGRCGVFTPLGLQRFPEPDHAC